MADFITVYDTLAGAVAVETRRVLVHSGSEGGPPVYEDQPVRTLERLPLADPSLSQWTHPAWLDNLAVRLAPRDHGSPSFQPGWVILVVVDDKPSPVPGQRLPDAPTGPGVVDLEAGTMTYPWTPIDLAGSELSDAVAETAAAKRAAINVERERRVYLPIGPVDLNGDGSLMVEPDIRGSADRDNLIAVHTRALQLQVAGVTAPVVTFGAADNNEYLLTPAQALALCAAPFDRASLLYQKARALKDGVLATAVSAGDPAAIAAIDETSAAYWT